MSSLESPAGADTVPGIVARLIWLWAALLAVLASLPSLFVGFVNDDLNHRLVLEGRVPGRSGTWFGLYDFTSPSLPASALTRQGIFPWFTDPALALRFLRPLSSATLALDHALFGRNALIAHVHSLLWMAVLAGIVGRLFQRWFSAPAALVSAVVFALSGVHAIPLSWLASRHTLVAASFGALSPEAKPGTCSAPERSIPLSLWGWVRLREDGYKPGLALSAVALVASLLSSESGLVTARLLRARHTGFVARTTRRSSTGGIGFVLPRLIRGARLWHTGQQLLCLPL